MKIFSKKCAKYEVPALYIYIYIYIYIMTYNVYYVL